MTTSKSSPQDFIRDSFTPQIGVLCCPKAEEICKRNNLSFIELLQPFLKLNSELQYKDPNGATIYVRNLNISLADVNAKPPHPTIARKCLNSSVSDAIIPIFQQEKIGNYTLDIPSSAPWFEAWRETFFKVQYPADHEFTKHFLACILVVASNDPNPVGTMTLLAQKLNHMQNISITKLPKWFNNNVLRYYVILHESLNVEIVGVTDIFETIQNMYGPANCFLLKTNSRSPKLSEEPVADPWSQFITNHETTDFKITPDHSPSATRALAQSLELGQEANECGNTLAYHPLSPDPEDHSTLKGDGTRTNPVEITHGTHLCTEDVEQIKLLIHEFCVRAFMPYIERQVSYLSDLVTNKKGVSKSLFSATKRWFSPNKPTSNSATINTLTYHPDAPELHIRRLGDLYFMFGHYTMAYQAYHTAKRDFMADQAWLYYAGSLEMAALSAFMANEPNRKSFDYMEESITTYLTTCKMAQFATRATLLSAECLKGHNMNGEAAQQLIRMTSEESDLRSALLLEQASYCFLFCSRPHMVRKYSFHMVLAGHRFSKSAQRKHSLRCYKQAYQIYQNKGWNLAEDHIHYTIGRQANNLHELEEAVQSYAKLLTGDSKQSSNQQAVFLKEYLNIHSALLKQQNSLLTQILPLPLVQSDAIKVLVGPTAPLRTPGKVPALGITLLGQEDLVSVQKWNKLEEMLVQEAQGLLPMVFKPLVTLFTNENISNINPVAVIGEPIQVSVQLINPLQILLNLKDIYLLWQFKDKNNRFAANEIVGYNLDHIMKTHIIKSIVLQAGSKQEVILSITPLAVGEVLLKGVCYNLISSTSDNEIALRGKQIFSVDESKLRKKDLGLDFKFDRRLDIKIVPTAPCLQVSFCEMHSELLRNELQEISVELRNIGSVPLHKIYMATSMPQLLSSCEFQGDRAANIDISNLESAQAREKKARKNHVSYLKLPNDVLEPGQYHNITIWMKAPEVIGAALIDLLIYYESVDTTSVPSYRLVRHIWQLSIQESIKVEASCQQSCDAKTVEKLALTVKATNLNKVHYAISISICLLKAALLSSEWILSTSLVAPKFVKMDGQESILIFLKACRSVDDKLSYSEVSFMPSKTHTSNSAYLDFAKRGETNMVNIFDNEDLQINKKHDATLILMWQAFITDSEGRKRTVYGQNQTPMNILAIEESIYDEYVGPNYSFDRPDKILEYKLDDKAVLHIQGKQVYYNLVHPHEILHNFNDCKLCIVPIELLVHNNSDNRLALKVETIGTSNNAIPAAQRNSLFYPYSSNQFRWIKKGSFVQELGGLDTIQLQLSVAVLGPGTFDLGSRIEIWCHKVDQPETAVLQTCRVQSSLIVKDANS